MVDDAAQAARTEPGETRGLLSAADIRALAERLGVRPTKTWGQNFVIDPNTVRKIVRLADRVGRNVFWPAPNVDSGLVAMARRDPPTTSASRESVFACIDAAFAQRRKTLRAALAGWAGGADKAEAALVAAGIDPRTRGERLGIEEFAAIAAAREAMGDTPRA